MAVTMKRMLVNYELQDGTVDQVRITNRARIAAELEGKRRGWGDPQLSNILRSTFALYEQLRLDGTYVGDWQSFREGGCVDFDIIEPDEATDELDPTTSAAAEPSASASPPQPE